MINLCVCVCVRVCVDLIANPDKRPQSQTSAKNTVNKDEYFKKREEDIATRKKEAEGAD